MGNKRSRRQAPPAIELTGKVRAIGPRGDGVVETATGAAYAPYTAPGDEGIFSVAGDRAEARSLTALSDQRADPICRHYGDCGGCVLQHLTTDYYRAWKAQIVVDALAKAGLHDVPMQPIETFPANVRRRASFGVVKTGGATRVGFNRRRSSRIAAIHDCQVLRPDLMAAMPALEALAKAIPADAFDIAATACANGVDINVRSRRFRDPSPKQWTALTTACADLPFVRVSLNGDTVIARDTPFVVMGASKVTPPPGGFLQASDESEVALARLVLDAVGPAKAVADLFCGVGAFALRMAERASVFAADADGPAIEALTLAAARGAREGLFKSPMGIEARNLEDRPLMATELARFGAVVFDPPRAGAAAQAKEVATSPVPTVVAVSCNPATFARDARILVDGGYRLTAVTPVDQFAFAAHVELVAVFQR